MEDSRNWGPRPFKFINAWALHSKFLTTVEKCWVESYVQGWASYKLMRKLSLLKLELKKWNVKVFGNVVNQLKKAKDDLHALDILAESRPLSSPETTNMREISNLVWKLRKRNDRIWFQKSRLNWAHNEDKNTKFFHIIASKRQSRNLLDSVLFNGIRYVEPRMIKQVVLRHFSSVFAENWACRPKLVGLFVTLSSTEVREVLEAPFTMEEVWRVVKESSGSKAPGPNGFNMACVQKCWQVTKNDIFQFLQEFHSNGRLVKGLNSSFIALIPKVVSPSSLVDFRPISLLNLAYKILSKFYLAD